MKKTIAFLLTLFTLTSLFAEQNVISFSAGVSTGVIFYGSQEVLDANEQLENGHRVILGANAEININPIKEVTFFTGCDLLSDFYNSSPYASNHLSLDIPVGLKIYPNLQGFCFGIAYCVGFRSDYYTLEEGKTNSTSPWGNGFKFLTEYNFAHSGKSKFLPTVGAFWKRIPRGNNAYDNQICAYVKENF